MHVSDLQSQLNISHHLNKWNYTLSHLQDYRSILLGSTWQLSGVISYINHPEQTSTSPWLLQMGYTQDTKAIHSQMISRCAICH